MSQGTTVEFLLDIAHQTVKAAPCASLITLDESGTPSSRSVAAFPPEADFSKIVVGTHPSSRKTIHVLSDPRVVLSYVDGPNRGYLTIIGTARIDENLEEKKTYWVDRFSAFFPDGPESEDYQLMIIRPKRLEIRSFGLKVAEEPTRWSPVILERDANEAWQSGG
ncbi:MAG: pyridoxamine 5'-phosphate oxidase family protein [Kiloniellales bacterium]|nr:pyridoxamine 5'-phosphate oxidase family protein [Kiloniellales bacterium]